MILKILLFPLSVLYAAVMRVRNHLYDSALRPSVAFEVPVISVGNLTVGGTGKTPMVEYLIRLLTPAYRVAVLSRGYGRATRGFRLASGADDASTIGDEPFQCYRKFADRAIVAVGEERALAIPQILQEHEDVKVILLDDAFQHRRVKPSLNILLSDYARPFYSDHLLPAGRLREPRDGASRAQIVVVTKVPHTATEQELMEVEKSIREYTEARVFFTGLRYGTPVAFGTEGDPPGGKCLLVTGIANPAPLVDYVRTHFELVDHIRYPDHHVYSRGDVTRIRQVARSHEGVSLLVTEKDMVKLVAPEFADVIRELPVYYIPVDVQFLKEGEEFDAIIENHAEHAG